MLITNICFAQQDIYVAPNGAMNMFPASNLTVFGNLINDASGGLNCAGGGDLYLYRHVANGIGNSRVYDGPLASKPLNPYNSGGAFITVWNLHTDNTVGRSMSGALAVNADSGYGNIQIEQELRVQHTHYFENGMIWTPRNKWIHAFINYYGDSTSYVNNSNLRHIDGYAAYTGCHDFIFPIGDGINQRNAGISNPDCGIFRYAYFKLDPQNNISGISGKTSMNDSLLHDKGGIVKVAHSEFWDIDGTANTSVTLSALNSVHGYSAWDSAINFNGKSPSDLVITGFNGYWQNLKINPRNSSMSSDASFGSVVSVVPDSGYSLFTWGLEDTTLTSVEVIDNKVPSFVVKDLNTMAGNSLRFTVGNYTETTRMDILLFSTAGVCLYKREFSIISGDNTIEIPMGGYAQGIYFLDIYSAEKPISIRKKIIKY